MLKIAWLLVEERRALRFRFFQNKKFKQLTRRIQARLISNTNMILSHSLSLLNLWEPQLTKILIVNQVHIVNHGRDHQQQKELIAGLLELQMLGELISH